MSETLGENQTRREAAQLYENVTLGSDTKVKNVMLMILLGRLSKTF